MSLQITKVGEGALCNDDRGVTVPVEGTYQGKPFNVEVYLGIQHNSAEITTKSTDALFDLISEHGTDIIHEASLLSTTYINAIQNLK